MYIFQLMESTNFQQFSARQVQHNLSLSLSFSLSVTLSLSLTLLGDGGGGFNN